VFDIPLGALTTATATNLVVAGRCIYDVSCYVHQATEGDPRPMATGESCRRRRGTAGDGSVRAVDITALRADLAAAGAIV